MKFKYLSILIVAGAVASVVACQPTRDADTKVSAANRVGKMEPKAVLQDRFDSTKVNAKDLGHYTNQKKVLQSGINQWLKIDDLKSKKYAADQVLVSISKTADPKIP